MLKSQIFAHAHWRNNTSVSQFRHLCCNSRHCTGFRWNLPEAGRSRSVGWYWWDGAHSPGTLRRGRGAVGATSFGGWHCDSCLEVVYRLKYTGVRAERTCRVSIIEAAIAVVTFYNYFAALTSWYRGYFDNKSTNLCNELNLR